MIYTHRQCVLYSLVVKICLIFFVKFNALLKSKVKLLIFLLHFLFFYLFELEKKNQESKVYHAKKSSQNGVDTIESFEDMKL